jgi:tripartite-type tricarboxylate transporter receptor subunit TctC
MKQATRLGAATAFVAAGLATLSGAAGAQVWPSKPIRAILAAAPGVPSDLLARGLMEPLSKSLGQPVIVENRVGADGIIGTEACAKAPPDGHTLCVTASNVMIWNPVLRANLPYDPINDFVPVVHAGFFDSALVAHPSVKANTVQQLFQLARSKPDSINWAHFGTNSTGYMYEEYLKKRFKAPFYPVPYKTQPQVLTALLTGEGQVAVYGLANLESHLKSGKLKAIAVTSQKRVDYLPKVPTFTEEGIKLPLRTWFGYHYPAGTPRQYVLRMNVEIRNAMADPVFKEKVMDRAGLIPNPGTPEEFDAYIKNQLREVRELVSYLGIKPE